MKKITYQPKQVRIFLALALLVLLVLAVKFFRQGVLGDRALVLAVPAVLFAVFLAIPRVFFPVYKAIVTASGYLGSFIFSVISVVVFFLILTPLSLVMKLLGKRFLHPRPDPAADTYYEEAESRQDIGKQF